MEKVILAVVAAACFLAALVWWRSARRLQRVGNRVDREFGADSDAAIVARSAFRKEIHSTVLYFVLAIAVGGVAAMGRWNGVGLLALILVPVIVSVFFGKDFVRESRLAEGRFELERR
ncbi:MAG TPA: hypothetical protein VGM93_10970, partial [Acidimicrobiales bacterium]